jgi:hypothetical protein
MVSSVATTISSKLGDLITAVNANGLKAADDAFVANAMLLSISNQMLNSSAQMVMPAGSMLPVTAASLPPIQVNVQVDGRTIATAMVDYLELSGTTP